MQYLKSNIYFRVLTHSLPQAFRRCSSLIVSFSSEPGLRNSDSNNGRRFHVGSVLRRDYSGSSDQGIANRRPSRRSWLDASPLLRRDNHSGAHEAAATRSRGSRFYFSQILRGDDDPAADESRRRSTEQCQG